MSRSTVLLPQADQDLAEIISYLAERNPSAAVRLREACLELAADLALMPLRGTIEPSTAPITLRRVIVPKFRNCLLVYSVTDEAILVVRILHSSRDRIEQLRRPFDEF